jgi:hypothetical protein
VSLSDRDVFAAGFAAAAHIANEISPRVVPKARAILHEHQIQVDALAANPEDRGAARAIARLRPAVAWAREVLDRHRLR